MRFVAYYFDVLLIVLSCLFLCIMWIPLTVTYFELREIPTTVPILSMSLQVNYAAWKVIPINKLLLVILLTCYNQCIICIETNNIFGKMDCKMKKFVWKMVYFATQNNLWIQKKKKNKQPAINFLFLLKSPPEIVPLLKAVYINMLFSL